MMMRKCEQRTVMGLVAAGASLLASSGYAQLDAGVSNRGFALNRFEPAESGSDWFVLDSVGEKGHLRPAAGLVLDYARKPLVLADSSGDEVVGIVDNHFFAHLGGSLVLWEDLRIGLNIPILLVNTGDGGYLNGIPFATDEGAALGDVRLAVDYRFLGADEDVARLSAGFRVHFPTGKQGAFAGDGSVRLTPQVAFAGDYDNLAYAARAGLGLRFRDGDFAGETFNTELQLGVAVGYRFLEDKSLLIGPELLAAPALGGDGDGSFGNTNPIELLVGAHYDFNEQWQAGLGFGPGLASGFGSPSFRVVANVVWTAEVHDDSDGDGIDDRYDACPNVPGSAHPDPALNGCPPPDGDGDSIIDALDACPAVAGVSNPDPTKHGCPVDADGDGIMDPEDACPLEPGSPNVDPARHGCPLAKIDQGQIKIAEQVQFETGSARIRPESDSVLQAVLRILKEHPEITRVSVEGHTDDRGTRELNRTLSDERAAAVVTWLVYNGISRDRLTSVGYGPDRPIDDNGTEAGRQKNRRVEFHIQDSSAAPAPAPENQTAPFAPVGPPPATSNAPSPASAGGSAAAGIGGASSGFSVGASSSAGQSVGTSPQQGSRP